MCGKAWLDVYRQTLSGDKLKSSLEMQPSQSTFKFGNDVMVKSLGRTMLPVYIGSDIYLDVEVIAPEIPLLLSRGLMKKMDTEIRFAKNEVIMLGKKQKVNVTNKGHLCIPLTKVETSEILFTSSVEGKPEKTLKKIASKLHQQFAHASSERLIKLLKDVGVDDKDFLRQVKEVVKNCEICQQYKRPPPRPVVCFPRARSFNIHIAVDLKQYGKKHVIHFIDHFTRFSVAVVVDNKRKETIIRAFLDCWLSIFGAPLSILSDNGGEFNNDEFKQLCEKFNITVKATAAESPWSNGVVERHNDTLGDMIDKLIADGYKLEEAAKWSCAAKNALSNNEGFSPSQLVFGSNPNFPTALTSNLPALDVCYGTYGEELRKRLDVMRDARIAYIKAESSEKLKRALRKQTRTHLPESVYSIGVYSIEFFRRDRENVWRGPAVIVRKTEKDIWVKQGGQQYRVHPVRIKHVYETEKEDPVVQTAAEETDCIRSKSKDVTRAYQIREEPDPVIEVKQPEVEIMPESADSTEKEIPVVEEKQVSLDNNSLPMPRSYIFLKTAEDGEWLNYRIESKGWRKGGANMFWYNVVRDGECDVTSIYWKDVYRWKVIPEDVLISMSVDDPKTNDAQLAEMDTWREYNVYEECEDNGQKAITCQWVLTQKYVNENRTVKARLVARGFQELDAMRKDSPTASPESMRLMLCISTSKRWRLNSLDVKAAFLQGDYIDRDVYIKPPPEAQTTCLWRLLKCVYGLRDASRLWYLRINATLIELGLDRISLDQAVYALRVNGELRGILCIHVDDMLWAGDKKFADEVITPLKKRFAISSEFSSTFQYLGLQINQVGRKITVDQSHYVKTIEEINIDVGDRPDSEPLTEKERKEMRSTIGKLVWASTRTRPDRAYEASTASLEMDKSTIGDVFKVAKHIRKLKNNHLKLTFVPLVNLEKCKIVAFSDASHSSKTKEISQEGHAIFLVDIAGNANLIRWKSKKGKTSL